MIRMQTPRNVLDKSAELPIAFEGFNSTYSFVKLALFLSLFKMVISEHSRTFRCFFRSTCRTKFTTFSSLQSASNSEVLTSV